LVENQEEREELLIEILSKLEEDFKGSKGMTKHTDLSSPMLYENAFVIHITGTVCDDDMINLLTKNEATKVFRSRSKQSSVIILQSE